MLHIVDYYLIYWDLVGKIVYMNTLLCVDPLIIENINTKQLRIPINTGCLQLPFFTFPHFHFAFSFAAFARNRLC